MMVMQKQKPMTQNDSVLADIPHKFRDVLSKHLSAKYEFVDKPMHKALNQSMLHYRFQFVIDKNTDTYPFRTNCKCCFSDENTNGGTRHVRQVQVSDDATVFIGSASKAKTSIIILGDEKLNHCDF